MHKPRGLATPWVVDSEVRSFSSLTEMPAEATYRFERLPSQQAQESGEGMRRVDIEIPTARH